jgi:hypothetical protein
MGNAAGRAPSKLRTLGAGVLAVLILTGAQSSCEQQRAERRARIEAGSESNSESELKSKSESKSQDGSGGTASSVVYIVTSDANIKSVTFVDGRGRTVTKTNVGHSWRGTGPAAHGTVLVSATTGQGSSMIKCSVRVHGTVVQRASAVGGGSTTVVCSTSY